MEQQRHPREQQTDVEEASAASEMGTSQQALSRPRSEPGTATLEGGGRDGCQKRGLRGPKLASQELLVGSCFSRIEYDDYWRIGTDRDIWLLANSLHVSTDADVERALEAHVPRVLGSVDKGVVPLAAGLFALLRRRIESVEICVSGALLICIGEDSIRADV